MSLDNILYALVAVLGLGTIYAWYQFYKVVANKCDTCSIDLHENPFKSKCFTGAVFFTLSLALAVYAVILL
ncbi:hypothetical protein HOB10_02595 [Candidatus Parcubacteria bacterium]|jgi:hypothetical protein|nr:hypothetical protein [Candidatus Parcubacteria bacterium]